MARTSDDWETCMLQCCDNPDLIQSIDSLDQCYYQNKPYSILWMFIVLIAVMVAIQACI